MTPLVLLAAWQAMLASPKRAKPLGVSRRTQTLQLVPGEITSQRCKHRLPVNGPRPFLIYRALPSASRPHFSGCEALRHLALTNLCLGRHLDDLIQTHAPICAAPSHAHPDLWQTVQRSHRPSSQVAQPRVYTLGCKLFSSLIISNLINTLSRCPRNRQLLSNLSFFFIILCSTADVADIRRQVACLALCIHNPRFFLSHLTKSKQIHFLFSF